MQSVPAVAATGAPPAAPHPHFEQLTIVRTGGFAGLRSTVSVDASFRVSTSSTLPTARERSFELDAAQAEQLVHAIAPVALGRSAGAAPASGAPVADGYQYDVEVTWNGITYRMRSVDLGADEALHGVVMVARELLAGKQFAGAPMTLRTEPPSRPALRGPTTTPSPATPAAPRPVSTWHPYLVATVDSAYADLRAARDHLSRYVAGDLQWTTAYRRAKADTSDLIMRIDDATSRFDDLPAELLTPLVDVRNDSQALLDELRSAGSGGRYDPPATGLVGSQLAARYGALMMRLEGLPAGLRPAA